MELPKKATLIYFIVHTFPIALFLLLLYSFYNLKRTANIFNAYTISIFVVFFMLIIAATLYTNDVFVPAFSSFTIFAVGLIGLVALTIMIYNTIIAYFSKIKTTAYFFLILLAVLVGGAVLLMILTAIFSNETMKAFFQTLLAIPNAIVELAIEFKHEFPHAPPAFITLFILEVVLILLVALIPFLIAQNPPMYSSIQFNGVYMLQQNPLNLTNQREVVLTNSRQLSIVDDSTNTQNPYKKQFTLSAWVYMNPSEAAQNPHETTLLYYGQRDHDGITNPKPRLAYQYDPLLKRDMYNVYLNEATPTKPTYRLHIPNQKWNQFIFVYNDNGMDLYINGHLEKAFPMESGVTRTYTQNDQIAVGDPKQSTYGAIANVIYYDYPMTANQVIDSWNKQANWVDGTLYLPGSKIR